MPDHSGTKLGNMSNNSEKLLQLARETGSIKFGHFVLASGATSNRYFEGKLLTLHPAGTRMVAEAMFELIRDSEIDAVGGLAMGAVPIATAIAMVSSEKGQPLPAFLVREVSKEHGTQRQIEGHFKKGARVAIVDDVITRGDSVEKAIRAVKEAGGIVVKVITIVDRHEGGADRLRQEGYDVIPLIDFLPDGSVKPHVAIKSERGTEKGALRPQPA